MSAPPPRISAREWRRRPPLRLLARRRRDACWIWVYCNRPGCHHHAAVAIVPYVIRWGPDDWPEQLRRHGRCLRCGATGVSLSHAGWGGNDIGWMPMPVERMAPSPL